MNYEGLLITITMLNSDTIWKQFDNCAVLLLYGNNKQKQQETRDLLFDYCKYNNQIVKEWEYPEIYREDNSIIINKHLKMADNKTMKFIIMEKDEYDEN